MLAGVISYFMTCCAEMDNLIGSLKDAGLCKDVHYKELYIPQAELEGEQSVGCYTLHKVTMMFTACFPASRQKATCSLLLLCCGCKTCQLQHLPVTLTTFSKQTSKGHCTAV